MNGMFQTRLNFLSDINCRIMAIIESGLMKVWKKRHWPKGGNKCSVSYSSVNHSRTKMEDIKGSCIALVLGIGLSCAVFILEVQVKWFISWGAKFKKVDSEDIRVI